MDVRIISILLAFQNACFKEKLFEVVLDMAAKGRREEAMGKTERLKKALERVTEGYPEIEKRIMEAAEEVSSYCGQVEAISEELAKELENMMDFEDYLQGVDK